jgi:3'-phosphoadenosine 5'-phosphosulfate sulfotransferase (PAPS reductase)/FAD synthetase
VLREYKFDLYFTGLSRYESRLREFSAKKYVDYFYSKTQKHWKCHPIQDWNEKDVWKHHKIFNIPHNSVYDKKSPNGYQLRTGCWCCTIPIKYGKIEFLRINYPNLWRILLKKGLGKIFIERKLGIIANSERVDHLMKIRPCMFDKY